jgi:hypothetical protein
MWETATENWFWFGRKKNDYWIYWPGVKDIFYFGKVVEVLFIPATLCILLYGMMSLCLGSLGEYFLSAF